MEIYNKILYESIQINKRKQLDNLYESLLPLNQDCLFRIYGINRLIEMPASKLKRAIQQSQETIKSNIREVETTFIRIK